LRTGKVVHYESLLRMLGDQGETIGPNAFIAVAERFGLIRELDRWVVETAIATQGASRLRNDPVSLTINLSARHFGSADMLELIRDATHRHRADPGAIVFEVTETAAVENFTAAREFIQALRNAGYRFALDDFGAGFSSFHYLKNLTVDYVKIDGSFVRHLGTDRADRIFVKAIADLAIGLGIRPIAEFVENRATVEHLLELGIPLGQGMYFAAPTSEFIAPALRATA
ncbi:MAG TPA: EAL domain-containing protein, partial [Plasticicumulans sp.]|nr:EAL domain-containing protein [Plasticicumulans sp.]